MTRKTTTKTTKIDLTQGREDWSEVLADLERRTQEGGQATAGISATLQLLCRLWT